MLLEEAHPIRSKKQKLPPSGAGSKFRNLAHTNQLHSLAWDATSEARIAVIDKVWPRIPALSTSGKMTACRYNADTKDLFIEITVTLHEVIPAITDPLCVPYLARCKGSAIQERMTRWTRSSPAWLYRIEIQCDPGVGDHALLHRGIPDCEVLEGNLHPTVSDTQINTDLYGQLRSYRERYVGGPNDVADLPEKMVSYIVPDQLADQNWGEDKCFECSVCWLIQTINCAQAHQCGHLTCKDCYEGLCGAQNILASVDCPSCRFHGPGVRPWADIEDPLENGYLALSSEEGGNSSANANAAGRDPEPDRAAADGRPVHVEEEKKEADAPGIRDEFKALTRAEL